MQKIFHVLNNYKQMPRHRSKTPLITNVLGDTFNGTVGSAAAEASLNKANRAVNPQGALDDLRMRLRDIERAMSASQIRAYARGAGAVGSGTSVPQLRTRVHQIRLQSSPNVTKRSKIRTRRMVENSKNVTARSKARTRRMVENSKNVTKRSKARMARMA